MSMSTNDTALVQRPLNQSASLKTSGPSG
jgi:hypothetical protein